MRYIHVSTHPDPSIPGSTYYSKHQKYPSARKRQAVASGHYRANDWGAEWYMLEGDRKSPR